MLTAVFGGLGATVCFTVAALCASSSSREIGAASTVAWAMVLGLCVIIVPLALIGHPSRLSGDTVALLSIAGLSNLVGLHLEYIAYRRVAVGVVTAVASTEGMVAAILSSIFGTPIATGTIILLAAITFGVVLTAIHLDPAETSVDSHPRLNLRLVVTEMFKRLDRTRSRATLLVVLVAVLFGITLYAIGRAGTQAPVIWVLLPARLFGTILMAAPLLCRRRLRISRRAFPLVFGAGAAEVVGLVSYTFGARQQLAVAAVLASQGAAITPFAAFFLFGERLRRNQIVGVAVVLTGVVLLSVLGS